MQTSLIYFYFFFFIVAITADNLFATTHEPSFLQDTDHISDKSSRLVYPGSKVTIWVAIAAIEKGDCVWFAFNDLPFVTLRTLYTDFFDNRLSMTTVRKIATCIEFTIAAQFDNHRTSTDFTVKSSRFIFDLNFSISVSALQLLFQTAYKIHQ